MHRFMHDDNSHMFAFLVHFEQLQLNGTVDNQVHLYLTGVSSVAIRTLTPVAVSTAHTRGTV